MCVLAIVFCINYIHGMQDFSSELNVEERSFCQARLKVTGDQSVVALCLSGGGFRAMLASYGFFKGAQKIKLLDRSMYMSALSGSTWFLGDLLARKIIPENFVDFEKSLQERVACSYPDKNNIMQALAQSSCLIPWRDLELIDVYGACVAERLFGDINYKEVHFSDLVPLPNTYPYPLFTAVSDVSKDTCFLQALVHWLTKPNHYEWMELSPFWVEMVRSGKAIPTKFFGSVFDAGKMITQYPEPPLSFILGVCGSAFSINFRDVFNYIDAEIGLDKGAVIADRLIPQIVTAFVESFEHGRLCPPRIPNILYHDPKLSKYFHDDEMIIHDAGTDFNLPIPPLLKKARKVKVIVVCDASDNASLATWPELHKAGEYAKKHRLLFPPLDKPVAKNSYACMFADFALTDIPVVVYIPLVKYQYSTLKFTYLVDEFENVTHYMEQAVVASQDLIQAAITLAANSRCNYSY